MSQGYITREQLDKLEKNLDEFKAKLYKMGIFTYISVNDVNNPTALFFSVKVDDIARFVIDNVSKDVKEKVNPKYTIINKDGESWISIIIDIKNEDPEVIKRIAQNAIETNEKMNQMNIRMVGITDRDNSPRKFAILVSVNDYMEYIKRSSLRNVSGSVPISMYIKVLNIDKFKGTYMVITFGSNKRDRVIG